jgi:ABC-type sugar transport system ATPase subunit
VPGGARVGIRPEHVELRPAGQGDLQATVALRETLGGDAYLYLKTPSGRTVVARAEGDTPLDHGDAVGLALPPRRLHVFDEGGRTLASGLAA